MPAGSLTPAPWLQFEDLNGAPCAGWFLYVYIAGTTTPLTVYQDAARTAAHPNPITLDAKGRCTIYLGPTDVVKYVLKDLNLVPDRTQDNVSTVALSAELAEALDNFRQALIAWPGSDATALLGTVYQAGLTKAVRAPGTGLFVIDTAVDVLFEATLWADAGGTATIALFPTGDPNTKVTGSELTSSNADGERKVTAAPITLAPGTYFIKGHSNHAVNQAWAVGHRIVPQ